MLGRQKGIGGYSVLQCLIVVTGTPATSSSAQLAGRYLGARQIILCPKDITVGS